jgi:hypothetical protein
MSPSFADTLALCRPYRRTVKICLDGALLAERDRLQDELLEAVQRDEFDDDSLATASPVATKLQELEDQVRDAEVEFVFQTIGATAWRALLADHRPRPRDKDLGYSFNADTLPVAAVAASAVDPELTPAQAEALADTLSTGQWALLWSTCLEVNVGVPGGGGSHLASTVLRAADRSE